MVQLAAKISWVVLRFKKIKKATNRPKEIEKTLGPFHTKEEKIINGGLSQ